MKPEDDLRLAASVDVPVLVTADSRRQRNMCARLIHDSRGYERPFVTFSVDEPGAVVEKASGGPWRVHDREDIVLRRQFELARGGTLFIDDIADLHMPTQALLHSLLDERLHQLPSGRPIARVRLVAGASRHLDTERATGAFCTTLFYRLNLIHIDFISHARLSS